MRLSEVSSTVTRMSTAALLGRPAGGSQTTSRGPAAGADSSTSNPSSSPNRLQAATMSRWAPSGTVTGRRSGRPLRSGALLAISLVPATRAASIASAARAGGSALYLYTVRPEA